MGKTKCGVDHQDDTLPRGERAFPGFSAAWWALCPPPGCCSDHIGQRTFCSVRLLAGGRLPRTEVRAFCLPGVRVRDGLQHLLLQTRRKLRHGHRSGLRPVRRPGMAPAQGA